MKHDQVISTIDSHTAGECTRVVTGGIESIPGKTMAEKKTYFKDHLDNLRKTLMQEPRGSADLVGAILTDPVSHGSDYGVLFIDSLGFEGMCGHGTIGLVTTLIETGQIEVVQPVTQIKLDTLTGVVNARARIDGRGCVEDVTVMNVPSFVYMPEVTIEFEGDSIITDIVFGGNFYAILPVERLGLDLEANNIRLLVEQGIAFRDAVKEQVDIMHPTEHSITNLHGVEMFVDNPVSGIDAQNIMVFGDHSYDRSPCGTGTSARLALLHSQGRLEVGQEFVHQSILGTTFLGRIIKEDHIQGFPAVVSEITGSAYLTGSHRFFVDKRDPFKEGFLLR